MATSDNAVTDWPQPSAFRQSITSEFVRYVSAIILTLMVITGYVLSSQYVKAVTDGIIDKLLVQARSYSGPAGKLIISGGAPDELLLNNICKKLSLDNPQVYWAGITDDRGVFIAHTDIKQVISSKKMSPIEPDQCPEMLRPGEGFKIRGDTLYICVPIEEGKVQLGSLALAASVAPIKQARTRSILTVVGFTALMIVVGIPVSNAILRRKLYPIRVIAEHVKQVDPHNIAFDIPVKSRNELGFLAETLKYLGSRLNQAQRELVEKERMARELEIAREIQANILPRSFPQSEVFELSGSYRSAKEVGGDYYDFLEFDDRHLGIIIADVSGKSLPGMLVMLLTRDVIKRLAWTVTEPADLLTRANAELKDNIKKGMFVTMFIGILDKQTGNLKFASAGHNPMILMREGTGKVEMMKTKGFPLGMVDTSTYRARIESGSVMLQPGDWIVLYTDGVNEAQNGQGEEFGMDRFISVLVENHTTSAQSLVEKVLQAQTSFVGDAPQYDDITLLAIKWKGRSADKFSRTALEATDAR